MNSSRSYRYQPDELIISKKKIFILKNTKFTSLSENQRKNLLYSDLKIE